MKRLILASFLAVTPALAQQASSVQQQIDSGTAEVNRIVVGWGNKIAADQIELDQAHQRIAELTKQIADLMKERDAMKASVKPDQKP